jgi:TonB-linked SusC/RagA family outer membrane protein
MKKTYKSAIPVLLFVLLLATQAEAQTTAPAPTAAPATAIRNVTVSGVVSDETGPMPGVTIAVLGSGSTRGTTTDRQGAFSIQVATWTELRFSFMGYEAYTYKVTAAQSNLKIQMTASTEDIETVVVMGPLSLAAHDVTSATTIVRTADLPIAPFTNVMEALQGRVPGLNVQVRSGAPGSTGTYVVRGISDISTKGNELVSSSPLIVVDGIPMDDSDDFDANGLIAGSGVSPLTSIPIDDIENFMVLKDAAATSLYGSKGAYGVIVINTKVGNSEKPQVSYSLYTSVDYPPRLRDVVGGVAERRLRIQEIMAGDTASYYPGFNQINFNPLLSDSLNPYYNNNTDWQDIYFNTKFSQEHNLSVSGGNREFNYKLNGNYVNQPGIVRNTGFDRYGIRTGVGFQPTQNFSLRANLDATLTNTNTGSGNLAAQETLGSSRNNSSLLPPPSRYGSSNAALAALTKERQEQGIEYKTSVMATYMPIKRLSITGTLSYRYANHEVNDFTPGKLNDNDARQYDVGKTTNSIYLEGRANYSMNISLIKLGLNLSARYDKRSENGYSSNLIGFPNDHIGGPTGYNTSQSNGSAKLSDVAGSVSFTFAPTFGIGSLKKGFGEAETGIDKYVFHPSVSPELNAAYGTRQQWAINPGLSFRWNASEEPFLKKYDWLSRAAVRTSWGRTSKFKASLYDIWGSYLVGDDTYNGTQIIPIDYGYSLPNTDLKAITNTMWDVGLDLYFWNHRLTLIADAYYKQTDNQLSDMPLADHNAFKNQKSTETSIVNYGLEFSLQGRPLPNSSPFKLNAQFNMAINRDVITKLPGGARQIINGNIVNKVGTNAVSNFLFVNRGVYATDSDVPVDPVTGERLRAAWSANQINNPNSYFRAGDPIWVDVNGDYLIDDRDRVITGNSQPRITGGFNLSLIYKNWSLNANSSFTLRRDIINSVTANNFETYSNPIDMKNDPTALMPISAYDFWTPNNTSAAYPNPFDYTRNNLIQPFRQDQTLFMEDGSYFKINTISLTYTFGRRIASLLGVRGMNVSATMNNIYTFSNYSGVSPENVNSLGFDRSSGYPASRKVSFRLQVNF